VDYGDVTSYLTDTGYGNEVNWFLENSVSLNDLEDAGYYREARLIIPIDAANDHENRWNVPFRGFFGVYGVGGYPPNLFKQRGHHKGVAFGRWMTNTVMVIAKYSPYWQHYVKHHGNPFPIAIKHLGCFKDSRERDLPFNNIYIGEANPEVCVNDCRVMGYR
jgi:hypothetical protein